MSTLSEANKNKPAKILSVSITCFIIIVYALILDIISLATNESDIKEYAVLSALPYIVTVIDILAVAFCILFCILGFCSIKIKRLSGHLCSFFAISTLGPTLSLVIHLSYILIAYLNDASYASSLFIYYTTIVFTLFRTLDVSYSTCIGALIYRRSNPLAGGGHPGEGEHSFPMFICGKTRIIVTFVFLIPVFILLILILMGMITAALVVIPINNALSDAPNRIWAFYQIVIVLVGAYFIYKKLFVKKPTIETVVEKSDESIIEGKNQGWENISKEEKLNIFYKHIMTIIARIDPENNNIKIQQQQQWQQQWQQQQQMQQQEQQ